MGRFFVIFTFDIVILIFSIVELHLTDVGASVLLHLPSMSPPSLLDVGFVVVRFDCLHVGVDPLSNHIGRNTEI